MFAVSKATPGQVCYSGDLSGKLINLKNVGMSCWRALSTKLLVFGIVFVSVLTSPLVCQTKAPTQPEIDLSKELDNYPGLLPELGQLIGKLQQRVQTPPARHQSTLLRLLPQSTTYYVALPNYGQPARETLATFRDELKQNADLRSWWQSGDMAKNGPEVESAIEKFSTVSDYLGGEIVISGETEKKNHEFVLIAEVRKPGLKQLLQRMLAELPKKSTSDIRVLDQQELAAAKSLAKSQELVVVVRPDFVIAAPGVDAVREFNQQLEAKKAGFASTVFGQRIEQSYQGGTTLLAAGDLHAILNQIPAGTPSRQKDLERYGFSDMKYLVLNTKKGAGSTISETELSFLSPRRSIASWLAAPAPLGSLDYVSSKAPIVLTVALKNPAEIFDDIRDLATASNPNAFATLPQMEQMMQVSLRDDLLAQLQGELTIEVEDLREQQPVWNVILRVNDAERLQRTFAKLLVQFPTRAFDKDGIRYNSIMIPSKPKPMEIGYVFTEGYMIIGSSRESISAAIGVHRSGQSLAKSASFLGSLPAGYPREASAVLYEDASAVAAFQLRRFAPQLARMGIGSGTGATPLTFVAYGDKNAIRAVSASGGSQVTTSLIVAAIAIPNLLRARIAANDASAVASMRTIGTAQIAYATAFPNRGFARDLVSLGPDPVKPPGYSAEHAGLLSDNMVANCAAKTTCSKDGYVFTLITNCKARSCADYVVFASAQNSGTGTKNLCLTSDGVVRVRDLGTQAPASEAECRKWDPLK